MLEIMPEPFEKMKARFPLALKNPIDVSSVLMGNARAASGRREHVFDFDDGMRMVVSIDKCGDVEILHASASGTKDYVKTVSSEGLDGFIEDVVLRLFGLIGKQQPEAQVMMTNEGVLHLLFEEYVL